MNFTCYDGETLNNKYILLGNNEKYVYNKNGLTSKECFDFLVSEIKRNKGINIIFRISFDIQFFIKDFGEEKIKAFIYGKKVIFEGYELQYFTGKFLNIKYKGKKYKLFDIYPFFNTSLLKVIDIMKIELTKHQKEILELGKQNRVSNFDKMNLYDIIEYNKTECIISSNIAEKIYNLMEKSFFINYEGKEKSFVIKNFYGSSAISSKILSEYGFDSYSLNYELLPANITKPIESAYFGGRMEAFKIGSIKNCFKYDINSAYPEYIKELKEIREVIKRKYTGKVIDTNLYYIDYKIFNPLNLIGILPYRHKSGFLFFPQSGKGWFYGFEIKQLIEYAKKYFIDYSISEEIHFTLGNKIFGETNCIENIYNQRLEYKNNNDLRHYIYKITLNAIYGKLAQKIGSATYSNYYYAGLITSYTRAKLLKAVINDYENIIFFATDGILSQKKLKLNIGENLGQWEEIKIKEGFVLLSGVYKLESEEKNYIGERGYSFDIDNVYNDILLKGFSEVKTSFFVNWKYGLKNHLEYKDKILTFTEMIKNINPFDSNIKRIFNFGKKPNIKKLYESTLIDINDLKKSKHIKIDFQEIEEIYENE